MSLYEERVVGGGSGKGSSLYPTAAGVPDEFKAGAVCGSDLAAFVKRSPCCVERTMLGVEEAGGRQVR